MYVIVLLIASAISSIMWYRYRAGYRLETLTLILWASTIMASVDKVYAYIVEGEEPIEATLMNVVLGVVLVASAIVLWLAHLAYARIRGGNT